MTRLGILTSGGDCPGINAVIRGAVLRGVITYGYGFVGFRDGWRGVLDRDLIPLPRHAVRGLARLGGTILGTSRTNPLKNGGIEAVRRSLQEVGVDGLVAIGGEGTLAAAQELATRGSRSSAFRKPSTTTLMPPMSRSGSTRQSRRRPMPSTGSVPLASRITAA